jgi:hypothetical protein
MTMKQLNRSLLLSCLILTLASCEETTVTGPTGASDKEMSFRSAMDRLWEDHIAWTRNVIINVMDSLPGANEATARLLQNQDDIGDAIKPYYGDPAGEQLSTLLRSHIMTAASVLTAAKSGDQGALATANAAWTANADSVSAFLSAANPTNWPEADMKAMMREHLRLTTNEALARLTKDYAADILAYDSVHTQILHMSDMLADGIIAQFPDDFED